MRVYDAAECGRHHKAGYQLGCDIRRNGKDNGIVGAKIDAVLGELKLRGVAVGKLQRNELLFEGNGDAVLAQPGNCRLHKDRAQTVARQKRAARLPAKRDGFPDEDARKLGRPFRRRNVERGEQQRLEKTGVERSGAIQNIGNRLVGFCPASRAIGR